ncbi:MAG: hypothetical protein CMN87_01040 [Stappia sp.]|uniref:Rap1a/Tai family immunity protein n=1 Tax=Stappia sp. TaxID=1870903 RepID=UPI000C3CE139|nr:Rap1a/Tai family immunity protein [Stappia sp.]MAA97272.1 hypothetical protein [Stappia sp.]MBM18571.1 hypothetical protein [Stappia sp.]
MRQAWIRDGLSGGRERTVRLLLNAGRAVLALGLLATGPALSEGGEDVGGKGWQTGSQIEAVCSVEPERNAIALTFCLGYLQGALDAFLLGRANCIPEDIDANGLRAAVLEHVRRHPDRAGKTRGPLLVYDAFRETWPSCAHMPGLGR